MKFQVINIKTGKAIAFNLEWHKADEICKRLNDKEIKYKIVEIKENVSKN